MLCYLGSQMTIKWLCLIFGITRSPCSCILKKFFVRLQYYPLAQISLPDEQKMQAYAEMISLHESTVQNVIGFIDGLGLMTKMTSEKLKQNAYYCGYDYDMMVNNVLVFGPDGKVFFCAINFLGSWLDGTLTVCFFSHIKELPTEWGCNWDTYWPNS